jgi:hypothetical protein
MAYLSAHRFGGRLHAALDGVAVEIPVDTIDATIQRLTWDETTETGVIRYARDTPDVNWRIDHPTDLATADAADVSDRIREDTMILTSFMPFVVFVLGGAAGRLHGGWSPMPYNKTIARALVGVLVTAPLWVLLPPVAVLAAAVGVACFVAAPHGSGIDNGTSDRDDPRELWRHLWAPKDNPAHDARFNAVSGMLVTLPVAIVLLPWVVAGAVAWPGLLIGLAGAVKALAYRFAWSQATADGRLTWANRLPRRVPVRTATDLAEVLNYGLTCALVQALWAAA